MTVMAVGGHTICVYLDLIHRLVAGPLVASRPSV
jgi:hypothetical protein